MYRLWSEWDIGEGNKIFATLEAGDEQLTVDEFIDNCFNDWGYFSWETLEVIQ